MPIRLFAGMGAPPGRFPAGEEAAVQALVVRWDVDEDEGRKLFSHLAHAALECERPDAGALGVRIEAAWPGWEETEALMRSGGWGTERKRARVLRIFPAGRLEGSIDAVDPDPRWIERNVDLAWTDEESPMSFMLRACATGEPDVDRFTWWTQDEVSFAVFEGLPDTVARFRAAAERALAGRPVDVSFEEKAA